MRNAALAPMVSFGLTMFAAQLVTLVGGRVEPITVLPISLGAPLLACAVAALRARSAVSPAPTVAERFSRCRLTLRRADVRLLLAAFLLALCIWTISIPSLSSVLPDSDGTHHALFAKRIMDLDTIDPRRVLAGDLTAGPQGGAYYPLALHLEAALIADITGLSVNTALTVGFVLAASVQLPTATYLLSRRLIPELGRLAAVAAVVAVVIPWFPYSAIWGAVPLIVGMSCVPAAVDALLVRRSDGSPVPVGILLGTAAFGLF